MANNEGVGFFKKVSFKEYCKAFGFNSEDDFTSDELTMLRGEYELINLPKRSTTGSAGYDFFLPRTITIKHGESATIPLGVRCSIRPGWMLMLFPRSGHGFKHGIHLANTVGIIDSDYFFSDNEGHIMLKLVNDSAIGEDVTFEAGTKICQGILVQFGTVINDNADGVRNGGFGSTGK